MCCSRQSGGWGWSEGGTPGVRRYLGRGSVPYARGEVSSPQSTSAYSKPNRNLYRSWKSALRLFADLLRMILFGVMTKNLRISPHKFGLCDVIGWNRTFSQATGFSKQLLETSIAEVAWRLVRRG